jgi:hypothetical protein
MNSANRKNTPTPNNFEFTIFKQKYLNKNSTATNTNINNAYRNFMKKRLSFAMNISNPNPSTKNKNSYKSENKLIKELKDAGKYDEWVKKGHLYGIILPNLPVNYKYTLMDGSIRKFSTITKSYRDGQINTPVFDMVGSNSNYVGQSSFKIVPNSKKLHTFGMSSCSGLTMKLGNQKFLSHIDAITNTSEMLSAIQECLRKQELTTSDISNVKIYRGFEKHNRSYQIINELLERLSIPKNNIEVIISRDGKCSI